VRVVVTSPRAVELFARVLGQERVVAAPVVKLVPRLWRQRQPSLLSYCLH